MKISKFFTAAVCLILFCGTAWAQTGTPTTLKGTFKGYKGEEAIFFTDLQDEMGTDIPVDADGNFSLTTDVKNVTYFAIMNIGQYFMLFYVEPGGTYIFDIDLGDETKYTITGTHAKENAVWKRYYFDFFQIGNITGDLLAHSENFKTYKTYVGSLAKSLTDEAAATGNAPFIEGIDKQVEESYLYALYYYAMLAAQKMGAVVDDPHYDSWLASHRWGAADEEALMQYGMFASAISYAFADVDRLLALRTLRKIIRDQNALNTIATSVMADFFSTGGKGDREQVYAYYKTICTDPGMLARIEQAYGNSKLLGEGSAAPDFTMKDADGNEYRFSDLRGKVLYVDVWATWCGPCLAEAPHFARLAERFENDDRIAFVSISIDDNLATWKKMVAEEDHHWGHYIVQGEAQADFSAKYQITGIPRFMLFDGEGRIISVNAPRPSREDMAEYLEELLGGPREETVGGLSTSFDDFYSKWRGKNRVAPDFTAYDAEGNPVRLSDYRGKTVILDFWFTSCHMCIKGFPALNELAAKYASQDVVVLAVCTPEDGDFNAFVSKNREKYPHLIWLKDRSAEEFEEGFAMKVYGMYGAPSQIIIDRNGIVVGATNFEPQIICALSLAGIGVDAGDLETAQIEAQKLESRVKDMAD